MLGYNLKTLKFLQTARLTFHYIRKLILQYGVSTTKTTIFLASTRSFSIQGCTRLKDSIWAQWFRVDSCLIMFVYVLSFFLQSYYRDTRYVWVWDGHWETSWVFHFHGRRCGALYTQFSHDIVNVKIPKRTKQNNKGQQPHLPGVVLVLLQTKRVELNI